MNSQPHNAIILCGGLSTRLGDITKSVPKILLDIGGKTVLDWQLGKLKALGIREVVLAAGHLSDVLKETIGEEQNGMHLTYVIEPERLGTGGAIKYAMQFVSSPDAPTWVFNGDILTTINTADMRRFLDETSDGIILGVRVPDASQYGTLEYTSAYELKAFKEKEGVARSGFINGGMYLFTPHAKKYFPEHASFSIEYDVFPRMKKLHVYESDKPWVDIGVPDRLAWARENWKIFL